jgi:hypothetical protein
MTDRKQQHLAMSAHRVLVFVFLFLTFSSVAEQSGDKRPRVYVETGPASEPVPESMLLDLKNSFAEAFPSYCPGAVVTENRSRASYLIRVSFSGTYDGEKATPQYSMAVFERGGDQVFADSADSANRNGIDSVIFLQEACGAIAFQMDSHTIFMLASQAKRRLLRVGFRVTYHASPKKLPNDKVRQITEANLAKAMEATLEYAFPLRCFCTTTKLHEQDTGSQIDYSFEVDREENWLSLIVFDAFGE